VPGGLRASNVHAHSRIKRLSAAFAWGPARQFAVTTQEEISGPSSVLAVQHINSWGTGMLRAC